MTERPFIIAVSNRKGGTGKTTTAVNLAAELGHRGFRTLLVDLDTQGHAALGCGVTVERGAPTVHHVLRDPGAGLGAVIRPTPVAGVWLAPADTVHDGSGGPIAPEALTGQLLRDEVVAAFDRIVIDTPPSLDALLINGLAAADGVLIPLLPHPLSAEGVQQLARLFFKVGSTINPRLKLLGVLPVMIDRRLTLHRGVLEAMARQFGRDRLLSGIRTDIHLAEAFAGRAPIRLFKPKSRSALDYHLLAEELTSLWRLPAHAAPGAAAAHDPTTTTASTTKGAGNKVPGGEL